MPAPLQPLDQRRRIDALDRCLARRIDRRHQHPVGVVERGLEVLHQIAENDHGVVLTERTDRFKVGGKWVELPVMGTFELRDGLITAWRDYFDMQQFTKQLPAAGS